MGPRGEINKACAMTTYPHKALLLALATATVAASLTATAAPAVARPATAAPQLD